MLALRVWIEEDFLKSEDAGWPHAEAWCAFVQAKVAAGDCTPAEALNDLRWFKHVAERSAVPEARMDGDGVFHLARAFMLLGAEDEAENLVRLAVKRSLPSPDRFPMLLPTAVRVGAGALAPTVWLAASGDIAAQRKIVENWPVLLRDGRKPLNWEMRSKISSDVLRETLLEALRCETPGAVRLVLKFVCADATAAVIRNEIEALVADHPSEVVRWKASRALAAIDLSTPAVQNASLKPAVRWTRLDALVLSGATKISDIKRAPKSLENVPVGPGMVPPDRPGHGWTLVFDTLRAAARRNITQALINGPLSRALHRRAPFGPAFEERPDVKAVREMAAPKNSLDEQMIEMAQAVMEFWVYGDEFLTLDLNGVAQVAAFLSSNGVTMDDDDVTACGAFIGEAIRKRMGGEWTGFDGNYRLEVGVEAFDPIGMAKILFERKDPFHGPLLASEMFVSAEARLNPEKKKTGAPRDTGASFERAIKNLCELPHTAPMSELMAETRVFSYRMEPGDWPAVLAACDPLLENSSGARIAAAICIYAPGEALARAWARWGSRRRETSGLTRFMAEAMATAAERDDLEAMPDWTAPVPASRFSFLNSLRKRANAADWRKILMLLLRQRTAAGDMMGVSWCLFSYKYEYPDSLALIRAFCAMTVSARQTLVRATRHCTRDEVKVFRPLWAEALRDPSGAVVLAALEAAGFNRAKSLRPLAEALKNDERPGLSMAATAIVDGLNTK